MNNGSFGAEFLQEGSMTTPVHGAFAVYQDGHYWGEWSGSLEDLAHWFRKGTIQVE